MKLLGRNHASIHTERLVLRPLITADAEPVFALFADWQVVRLLSAPPWPYSLDDARDFVRRSLDPADQDGETAFSITRDNALIGGIGVRERPASHLQRDAGPNFGYWLGRAYWGKGFMTEALRAMVRFVFDVTSATATYSGAFAENAASLRVQAKVGFREDGQTMLSSHPRGGAEFAHVNTVLPRSDFEAASV